MGQKSPLWSPAWTPRSRPTSTNGSCERPGHGRRPAARRLRLPGAVPRRRPPRGRRRVGAVLGTARPTCSTRRIRQSRRPPRSRRRAVPAADVRALDLSAAGLLVVASLPSLVGIDLIGWVLVLVEAGDRSGRGDDGLQRRDRAVEQLRRDGSSAGAASARGPHAPPAVTAPRIATHTDRRGQRRAVDRPGAEDGEAEQHTVADDRGRPDGPRRTRRRRSTGTALVAPGPGPTPR